MYFAFSREFQNCSSQHVDPVDVQDDQERQKEAQRENKEVAVIELCLVVWVCLIIWIEHLNRVYQNAVIHDLREDDQS